MTLVFNRTGDGPGTHVLIIGVGAYPQLGGRSLASPAKSATEFARWMVSDFKNPTAELASVEVLASQPDSAVRFEFSGEEHSLDPPTLYQVQKAAGGWLERANSDERNIAVFYFSGHGTMAGDDTMLLLDGDGAANKTSAELPGVQIVSFRNILGAMLNCSAGRQVYFVDTARDRSFNETTQSGTNLFSRKAPSSPESVERAILYATGEGQLAFETPSGSLFSQALLGALNEARSSPEKKDLSIGTLYTEISRRMTEASVPLGIRRQRVHIDGILDIDFHYPITNTPDNNTAKTKDGQTDISAPPAQEANTDFVLDDAEFERDDLGRAVIAIGLARRLHRIWRQNNSDASSASGPFDRDELKSSFVVHIDAPWGGGKTTFANLVARVLNPNTASPRSFLRQRYGDADLGSIYLEDPPTTPEAGKNIGGLPEDIRRPWIVVDFNAWRAEHCAPPWWLFYQSIRDKCFETVRTEGTEPWAPSPTQKRFAGSHRWLAWLRLWLWEYWWRLTNPKIRILLLTAVFASALLILLQAGGFWGTTGTEDKMTAGFFLTSGVGLILAGLSGGGAIWGLGALFTESIVPGTDTLAERLSLGNGDPFHRFRKHFHKTMHRLKRPVLVVIDDLDRCKPEFVVDLVRGLQTLLRSPRVTFLILGDRDWLEEAFESHHSAMSKIDVGPEQTFGARFVEKAIQMSFILPSLGGDDQANYVRRVLLGTQAEQSAGATEEGKTLASAVREFANQQSAVSPSVPLEVENLVEQAVNLRELDSARNHFSDAVFRGQVEQAISETLAINAAVDEKVEQAVVHELQDLSGSFPSNPRQIKRIINAITIYWAVALQRSGLKADAEFRFQLAIWIIIMTEWPETWRLLVSCPDLVDCLTSPDPQTAAAALPGKVLPGSLPATIREIKRITADSQLLALIGGSGATPPLPLTTRYAKILSELTPLHTRRKRLLDEPSTTEDGKPIEVSDAKSQPAANVNRARKPSRKSTAANDPKGA